MNRERLADAGRLPLRLTYGGLMLFHGVHKALHGLGKIPTRLTDVGVPGFVACGVYLGEVVAPLLMCLGLLTRPAAAVVAFNMAVAVLLVHRGDLLRLTGSGAWAVELQLLYLLGAAAVALLGAGRYSLSRGRGRWD